MGSNSTRAGDTGSTTRSMWRAAAVGSLTAIALVSVTVAGSAHSREVRPVAAVHAEHGSPDGASVVRGVFFGQGDVARLLPEVWAGRSVADRDRLGRQADLVVAVLAHDEPALLVGLRDAVASRDRQRIASALDASVTPVQQAIRTVTGRARAAHGSSTVIDDCWMIVITNPYCGGGYVWVYVVGDGQNASAGRSAPLSRDIIVNRLAGA